jgi:excisionase family DNA binding protein
MRMKKTLLTPEEAANRLGISTRSIYRLIDSEQLPSVRGLTPAAPIRIHPDDLALYKTKRETTRGSSTRS